MNINLFGIKTCDKVRSATKWLIANKINYHFIDLKSRKLKDAEINIWLKKISWNKIINKNSSTWRALTDDEKLKIVDCKSAKNLIIKQPLVMKRPIIEFGQQLIVGFSEKNFEDTFR